MAQEEPEIIIPPEFQNKKLICRVWSNTGEQSTPNLLGKKKVKYGVPEFSIKIGGKMRLFRIIYKIKGVIKQEGKHLYYDTVFNNTTGALAFYEFPEDMDSEESYTVFKNNAVNMYVKKGGIPAILLYISFLAVIILAVALAYVSPYVASSQQTIEQLDSQITQLKQNNAILQQQLLQNNNGGIIG